MTTDRQPILPLDIPGSGALADDVLVGADAIARHMGLTKKQVYAHIERGHLPCFRIGALICMRRSTLMEWIVRQERSSAREALEHP